MRSTRKGLTMPGELLQHFKSEKKRHLDQAQELVDLAKSEGRGPTDDEHTSIERHMTQAREFDGKIKEAEDTEALQQAIADMGRALTSDPKEQMDPQAAASLGEAFIRSAGYTNLLARGTSGRWTTQQVEVPTRILGTAGIVTEGTGTNADAIPVNYLPGLYTPSLRQQPLTLAALFSQGETSQPVINYQIAKTRTEPANHAVTAEGTAKPAADFTFDNATATLEKLAAFIKVSEEMLADSPAIRDYINAQLPLMVRQAEEYKLADEIYGAASGSGLASTLSGVNGFDSIAAGIEDIQSTAFFEPDGLFIAPIDFWTLAVSKSAVSGDYYSGGPYAAPERNPWGVRVVISNMAPVGYPLVGAFRQGGQVWRKGGVTVEATNSNEDDFKNNLVAIRAEERVALAVYYPEAFALVNLAS